MAFNSVKRSSDLGAVTLTKNAETPTLIMMLPLLGHEVMPLLLKICIISYQRRRIYHTKLPFGVKLLNSGSQYPSALLPAL